MTRVSERGATTSEALLAAVADALRDRGGFPSVRVECGEVVAAAPLVDAATYRVGMDAPNAASVSWASGDRYLSQSIEASLVWTGEDPGELIDDELGELGWTAGPIGAVDHYRDERNLFIFRCRVPISGSVEGRGRDAEALATCVLAFEAAFRELGDMRDDGPGGVTAPR